MKSKLHKPMEVAAWGNGRGRGWANGCGGGGGFANARYGGGWGNGGGWHTAMVHGAMAAVAFLGIGETPSHSSLVRPLTPL